MKLSTYKEITELFPISPLNPFSLPEKLKTGQRLNYVSRLTIKEIQQIIIKGTSENPEKIKDTSKVKNWKSVIQRDADGNIIKVMDEDCDNSKEISLRRWEPVQFNGNRNAGKAHISTLIQRYSRVGYQPVRTFTVDWEGRFLDGQHGLLSLWYYLTDYEIDYVDIDIRILGKPSDDADARAIFRLFDQAAKRRTLRDALSTVTGIPDGFEAEVAGMLRFGVLLASGQTLQSSRLQLPHVTNAKGKLAKLESDDVAQLIESGQPFEEFRTLLDAILDHETLVDTEDPHGPKMPALVHPGVSGSGLPNPQYYLTAFANHYFTLEDSEKPDAIEKYKEFLTEILVGAESKYKSILKFLTYRPDKATKFLPIIEGILKCFMTSESSSPKKMPSSLTHRGIEKLYSDWYDENCDYETEPEEIEEIEETDPAGNKV